METGWPAPVKTWLFIQGSLCEGVSVSSVWAETEAGRREKGVMARTGHKKVDFLAYFTRQNLYRRAVPRALYFNFHFDIGSKMPRLALNSCTLVSVGLQILQPQLSM